MIFLHFDCRLGGYFMSFWSFFEVLTNRSLCYWQDFSSYCLNLQNIVVLQAFPFRRDELQWETRLLLLNLVYGLIFSFFLFCLYGRRSECRWMYDVFGFAEDILVDIIAKRGEGFVFSELVEVAFGLVWEVAGISEGFELAEEVALEGCYGLEIFLFSGSILLIFVHYYL